MKIIETIGIDVSKLTLDVYLYIRKLHFKVENNPKGFTNLLLKLKSLGIKPKQRIFCMENTGLYSEPLARFLFFHSERSYVVPSILIKRSMGLVRGKNDKLDAFHISRFASIYQAELTPFTPVDNDLINLRRLLSLREQLLEHRKGLLCLDKEHKKFLNDKSPDDIISFIKPNIEFLNRQIKDVEGKLISVIKSNKEIATNFDLLISIKGIGLILAIQLIIHTGNFTRFSTWRKFACYCGIAPFEKQSGTSLHIKGRIHPFCDKKLKSLLTMASINAIRTDNELKAYYQKKIAEGKPKMCAINIIRNKLVARAFAVIKRGTPFVVLFQHAA
jgi:transposase